MCIPFFIVIQPLVGAWFGWLFLPPLQVRNWIRADDWNPRAFAFQQRVEELDSFVISRHFLESRLKRDMIFSREKKGSS